MTSNSPIIYVLYNAKASLFGKLNYACRKISAPADQSACAACDLTHGGLRLSESEEWKATKQKIPAQIKQLHTDELTPDLSEFVATKQLKYPVVLGQTSEGGGALLLLLTSEDLAGVSKSHSGFLDLLLERSREKGIDLQKQWKDGVVDPISRGVPNSITPGLVTFAAFVCGLCSCLLAMVFESSKVALVFWLLNRLLDCLDGSLARARNQATQLGGFFDLLSDFIVYSLLPIAIARGQSGLIRVDWTALALLEASFHVNNFVLFYVAAVAADKKDGELTSVTMKPALIEGFESGTLFTMMLIWPAWINTWCWVMAMGVAIGTVQRVSSLIPIIKRLDAAHKSK